MDIQQELFDLNKRQANTQGQVNTLIEGFAGFRSDIKELVADIKLIQGDIHQIASVQTKVEALETRLSRAEKKLESLREWKWTATGVITSIAVGAQLLINKLWQ